MRDLFDDLTYFIDIINSNVCLIEIYTGYLDILESSITLDRSNNFYDQNTFLLTVNTAMLNDIFNSIAQLVRKPKHHKAFDEYLILDWLNTNIKKEFTFFNVVTLCHLFLKHDSCKKLKNYNEIIISVQNITKAFENITKNNYIVYIRNYRNNFINHFNFELALEIQQNNGIQNGTPTYNVPQNILQILQNLIKDFKNFVNLLYKLTSQLNVFKNKFVKTDVEKIIELKNKHKPTTFKINIEKIIN